MATNRVAPPPPPGFVLDNPASPPPGFVLDTPSSNKEERTLSGFGSNLLTSTAGLFEPLLHPIDTAKGTAYSIAGVIEKMSGADLGHAQYADAVGRALMDRYGSWEAIKKTAYDDPAGLAADAASVVSGLGGVMRGGAVLGTRAGLETGKLATAGKALTKAGTLSDPVNLATRGVSNFPRIPVLGQAVKAPAYATSEILGVFTGVGGEAIRTAASNPSPALKAAMRGQTEWIDVVNNVKEAVKELKEIRGNEYRARMKEVFGADKRLDLNPFRKSVSTLLKDFRVNVKMVRDEAGNLTPNFDLDYSTISKEHRKKVKGLLKEIAKWKDTSPEGVDALRRLVDDYYIPSGEANALISSIRNRLVGTMDKQLPGYSEMTAGYKKAVDFINMVEGELSAGRKVQPGTMVRKLSNTLNEKTGFRQTMLDSIDQYIPVSLRDQLAGKMLESMVPQGIMRPLTGGGLLMGVYGGSVLSPGGVITAAATSPRLVGEAMVALSRLRKAAHGLPYYSSSAPLRVGQYGSSGITVRFQGESPSVTTPEEEPTYNTP